MNQDESSEIPAVMLSDDEQLNKNRIQATIYSFIIIGMIALMLLVAAVLQ